MIMDTFLNNIAKWINGESASIISHTAYTSTVITPATTDTSVQFSGEYDRTTASGTRNLNEVSFNSVRSGAIASSGGDTINTVGLFNAGTGAELLAEATVPSLLHTTDFDVESDWVITIQRKS